MYPWFIWHYNAIPTYICLFTSLLALFHIVVYPKELKRISKKDFIVISIGFLALLWESQTRNVFGTLQLFALYIIVISLFTHEKDFLKDLLNFITKWFSILLAITLFAYILYLFGIVLISPTYIQFPDGRYFSLNYFFFLMPANVSEYFRFRSIFMEPGHLTMGLIPLIIANRFDLKNRYVLILFIVELFTFSLAGYIVMFICYFLLNFSLTTIKKILRLLIMMLFVITAIFIMDKSGNSEILDKYLWERLEYSNGTIAGNNRTSAEFDRIYENTIQNSYYFWTGNPYADVSAYGGISGYKKYVVQYGIIGIILSYSFYSMAGILYRKRELWIFSLALLLLLYQNAYPFWNCVIITYILGINSISKPNENV